MSTIRINEVVRSDEEKGRDGYILSAEQKLRIYTLKEIVNTEEEYAKLLQYIVDVIIRYLKHIFYSVLFVASVLGIGIDDYVVELKGCA